MSMIEDIMVVYRLTRGTEKRIFKVNVGKLPKAKAMTYMTYRYKFLSFFYS